MKKLIKDTDINDELVDNVKKIIDKTLTEIPNNKIKEAVKKFWHIDFIKYYKFILKLESSIANGKILPETACPDILSETEIFLRKGEKLEEFIQNDAIIKTIKNLIRITVAPYFLQAEFVKHAILKPRGYAGDYEILEYIYNDQHLSQGLGYCIEELLLKDQYADAVRNRKDHMKKILTSIIKTNSSEINILNIACGVSRELREIFIENKYTDLMNINFTLVDKDPAALDFSKKKLKNSPENIKYEYLNHSVYDYLKNPEQYKKILKNKDIIYSIGLIDYIPDDNFKALINFLFNLLKPKGKLILAHKDSKNYHPLTPDWLANWTFYLRNEYEVVQLINNSRIEDYSLKIEKLDSSNIIFFLKIEKNS